MLSNDYKRNSYGWCRFLENGQNLFYSQWSNFIRSICPSIGPSHFWPRFMPYIQPCWKVGTLVAYRFFAHKKKLHLLNNIIHRITITREAEHELLRIFQILAWTISKSESFLFCWKPCNYQVVVNRWKSFIKALFIKQHFQITLQA